MRVFSVTSKLIQVPILKKDGRGLLIGIFIILLFSVSFPAWSADVYIAQSIRGDGSAASCANAKAISYLTGSWSGKISAGDTVHLCGTLTSSLTVGGSGTSGSPITIKFEDGAKFSAPYWPMSGAIYILNKNYITIDGGTNGIVENTHNGTNTTYSVSSQGVVAEGCSNLEIKNLTVQNIYVHVWGSNVAGVGGFGIAANGGSNIKIHHNKVHDAAGGIAYNHTTNSITYSNIEIYNNIISRCNWAMGLGIAGTGTIVNNLNIYNNDMEIGANWTEQQGLDIYHLNGIFVFGNSTGSEINNFYIYNNYIHGPANPDGAWTCTGFIFISCINGTGFRVFNNVFDGVSGNPMDAYLQLTWATTTSMSPASPFVANNTIIGYNKGGRGIAHYRNNGSPTIKNNILANLGIGIHVDGTNYSLASDNNIFYNTQWVSYWGGYLTTILNLQTKLGGCPGVDRECNSIGTNPDLKIDYTPNLTSPIIGKGFNLTSVGIPSLNKDKRGTLRPPVGGWDIGAFSYGYTTSPPQNLMVK